MHQCWRAMQFEKTRLDCREIGHGGGKITGVDFCDVCVVWAGAATSAVCLWLVTAVLWRSGRRVRGLRRKLRQPWRRRPLVPRWQEWLLRSGLGSWEEVSVGSGRQASTGSRFAGTAGGVSEGSAPLRLLSSPMVEETRFRGGIALLAQDRSSGAGSLFGSGSILRAGSLFGRPHAPGHPARKQKQNLEELPPPWLDLRISRLGLGSGGDRQRPRIKQRARLVCSRDSVPVVVASLSVGLRRPEPPRQRRAEAVSSAEHLLRLAVATAGQKKREFAGGLAVRSIRPGAAAGAPGRGERPEPLVTVMVAKRSGLGLHKPELLPRGGPHAGKVPSVLWPSPSPGRCCRRRRPSSRRGFSRFAESSSFAHHGDGRPRASIAE